jgi:prevent-host-death family protein
MNEEIGAYEAKTRLPELLRAVKAGRRFTITNRGEAVADLVPTAAATLPERRATIERFQAFRGANPVPEGAAINIRALIDEGRQ